MKVLWVVNTIFPDLAKDLGQSPPNVGGWMYGLSKEIKKNKVDLVVCTVGKKKHFKKIDGISYYMLEQKKSILNYDKNLEYEWKALVNIEKPNVIHFHGTEYPHGLALLNVLDNKFKTVVSIQGLISVYHRFYLSGLNTQDILRNITIRDLLKFDTLFQAKRKMKKRAKYELRYIINGKNFVGRTDWDHANIKAINPAANYHFCNETLRDGFYNKQWDINKIQRYTIFLSQANYPIKGLHVLLKAVAILKDEFPEVKIRIGGGNILRKGDKFAWLKMGGYGRIIKSILIKNKLENNVEFLGNLNEQQMISEYLSANLFVCPSSIENSPNSLGEAQIIGVPSIASFVGGVPSMVEHQSDALLYRFEDFETLAYYIKRILTYDDLAISLSEKGRIKATKRHDRLKNAEKMIELYQNLYSL